MASPDWLWSLSLGSPVRALSIAREAELLLARLDDHTLVLLTTRGDVQARASLAGLAAGCIADDGSTIAAAGTGGQVWLLARDLQPRTEHTLPAPAQAIAVDGFGRCLAVSDRQGAIYLLDEGLRESARVHAPRAIHHLAFAATQPHLLAAADFGWAGCLDLATRQWLWTDRPVANIGALAVAGSGDPALLACFSDGLRRYGPNGSPRTTQTLPGPCGLAALSFTGERGIAAGVAPHLYTFDARAELTATHDLEAPLSALALAALGERAFAGGADGRLLAMNLKSPGG